MMTTATRGRAARRDEDPSARPVDRPSVAGELSAVPSGRARLRFSAVVGQDDAKRALLLAATRPAIAGVLLRGDKGSGKTTLARGLAAVLPGDAPFVELPLGATEERVVGSLDLGELLANGRPAFHPGLLATAHGGVLYVDEVNLLADHLVDVLLDVAVSGVNRVERDGVSHTHPARFVLVASMNPEEGELRPQLLDRFGLSVDVRAPVEPSTRAQAVRRQLGAEAPGEETRAGDSFAQRDAELARHLRRARDLQPDVPDDVVDLACRLALEVGAEGLRADLMLCRAAAASASLAGHDSATADDVREVAPWVLGHRRRRRPFDEPGISDEELSDAWDRASEPPEPNPSRQDPVEQEPADRHSDPPRRGGDRWTAPEEARPVALPRAGRSRAPATAPGGFATAAGPRGRRLADTPYVPGGDPVDGRATAVALATRRASDGDRDARPGAGDLRSSRREQRRASLVVLVVDASGSMGVAERMAATKGAVLGLLGDAYRRRGKVALVTFRGEGAETVLRPTGSLEVARARLAELGTGGSTPLAAGVDAAAAVVTGSAAAGADASDVTVAVVTDGRATVGGDDPVAAARSSMAVLAATGARVLVVDTETGYPRLGLAAELAATAGAEHRTLADLTGESLESLVRAP